MANRMQNEQMMQSQMNRILPSNTVNLQNGAESITATDLNQVRSQTLKDMLQRGDASDMRASLVMTQMSRLREDMRTDRLAQQLSTMKTLNGLDQVTAGRGVSKPNFSPAQNNGYFPQNPQFFGMQRLGPTPYQQIVNNRQNLMAVVQGYQSQGLPGSQAALLDQLKRKAAIIAQQNRPDMSESIFAGVHSNPGVNLYRIRQKNTRENEMFSLK